MQVRPLGVDSNYAVEFKLLNGESKVELTKDEVKELMTYLIRVSDIF